ncbi:hypothetical protein [Longimicrobium sp.]|uniref:hypothetical protein n=1 Tax=Longimicrobium sp. TaxID=2029185 RepID=UPI003B3B67C3
MISIRFTAIAALLVLSTACGGGGDDDTVATDTTAAATPSAAPASTDSAAVPASTDSAAAGDTTWALRHDGIGPLRVGMTAAQAEAALGSFRLIPFNPGAPADSMACGYAGSDRLPAGVKVMMEGARVVRLDVVSGDVATAGGARIGDTEARVQQLYPGRVTVGPHKYTDGHYLTVRPAEASDTTHLIVFETDGQKVLRYRGGQKPQVEYVESCA